MSRREKFEPLTAWEAQRAQEGWVRDGDYAVHPSADFARVFVRLWDTGEPHGRFPYAEPFFVGAEKPVKVPDWHVDRVHHRLVIDEARWNRSFPGTVDVTGDCPHCGRRHHHNVSVEAFYAGFGGQRSAHCPDQDGSYMLVRAEYLEDIKEPRS